MPKIDLHLHLDGSVKPKTVLSLAKREKIKLPVYDERQLRGLMQIDDNCDSLTTYLSKFELVSRVLHSRYGLEQVAMETVEQAFKQNCKYIEVRFGPQLHRKKGLSLEQVIEAVINGLKKGERMYGVKANAIACCLRHHSIEENKEVIEAATGFVDAGLVAVDLAGDEATYPAQLFHQVFELANKKDLPITIHAGEAAGPENIDVAVNQLGANRIGHGVRLRDNLDLLDSIHLKQIPLEMCPISNIQTKTCNGWNDYPIRDYFDRGLLVTVNTDNLTVSNTTLTKEWIVLAEKYKFTVEELHQLSLNSIQASFLSKDEKAALSTTFASNKNHLDVQNAI